jgi:hypothetical protein
MTTYTTETLEAARASVKEWERKRRAKNANDIGIGSASCPLCAIFFRFGRWCAGCPVRDFTGNRLCSGSPYGNACRAFKVWKVRRGSYALKRAWHKACDEEIIFLRGVAAYVERNMEPDQPS